MTSRSRSGPAVVFHVGAHKTGTSLIQAYLKARRGALSQQGVEFITRGGMAKLFHWGRQLRRNPAPVAARIAESMADPARPLLFLSHENTLDRPFRHGAPGLYPMTERIVPTLVDLLADYDHRVVLSVRPHEGFLESYYLQTIHEGSHQTFERWLDRIDLDAISWLPMVQTLIDAFGRDRVEIVDFRLIEQGQQAYIRHFLSLLDRGLRLDTHYDAVANSSLSAKGLEMALAANPYLKTPQERGRMRKFLQSHFSNQRFPRPTLLAPEQKHWLQQRYGAEYDRLVAGGVGHRSGPGGQPRPVGER